MSAYRTTFPEPQFPALLCVRNNLHYLINYNQNDCANPSAPL